MRKKFVKYRKLVRFFELTVFRPVNSANRVHVAEEQGNGD
jgi:hypothetical protein